MEKWPLAHVLENAKIKYAICIQFRYPKQTKNTVLQISVIVQRITILLPMVNTTKR